MSATALRVPSRVETQDEGLTALSRLLSELSAVLTPLDSTTYTARLLPGVSGSIGEHVRHTLDHVAAFTAMRPHALMTYDQRERGTPVETDPRAAQRMIVRLQNALADAQGEDLDISTAVMSTLTRGEEPVLAWSTRKRELAFVISHTVHHQALIAVLLAIFGNGVPTGFGFAASTPGAARA